MNNKTDDELRAELKSMEEVARMIITVIDENGNAHKIPDEKKQAEALRNNLFIMQELNHRAVAKQNAEGELMVVYARGNTNEAGNTEYDAWIHLDCDDGPPDWDKIMISEDIKAKKCLACGHPLDRTLSTE